MSELFVSALLCAFALLVSGSDSCMRSMTCPCGASGRTYRFCYDSASVLGNPCQRWSKCETCHDEYPYCVTCPAGYSGDFCTPDPEPAIPESEMECVPLDPVAHGTVIRTGRRRSDFQGYPDVENPVGLKLKYSCDKGYVLKGPNEVECLANGFWSTSPPICVQANVITCSHPGLIENGAMDVSQVGEHGGIFIPGTPVRYSCKDGFTLHGEKTIFCLYSGLWSAETPKCERTGLLSRENITCSHPGVDENGEIVDVKIVDRRATFAIGTRLSYKCKPGFNLFGDKTVSCLNTGSWSGPAPRCEPPDSLNEISEDTEVECFPISDIPHGRIASSLSPDLPFQEGTQGSSDIGVPVGTRLQISCEDGYLMIGRESVECLPNGFWSAATPTCVKVVSESTEVREEGLEKPLKMLEMLKSQPEEISFEVACVPSEPLDNGKVLRFIGDRPPVEITEDTKVTTDSVGTRLQYSCNPGYKMIGEEDSICEPTGSWSTNPPYCVKDKP